MDAISDDLDRTVAARRGVLATLRKCAKLSRRCGMEIAFYAADAKNKWSVGYETTPATSQHLHNTTSLVYTNRDAEWLQKAPWKSVRKRPRCDAMAPVPPNIFKDAMLFSSVAQKLATHLEAQLVRTTTALSRTNCDIYELDIMMDFGEIDGFSSLEAFSGVNERLQVFLATHLPSYTITKVTLDFTSSTIAVCVSHLT